MTMQDLSSYNNDLFNPGGNPLKRILWYYINILVFKNGLFPLYILKVKLLRAFGAKIGKGVVIKPHVSIKYPWNLEIGDHVWVGENVWIDNLVLVKIGNNCCISQGAVFLTGNHNFKNVGFDLMVNEIVLNDRVWIGAMSIVTGGVVAEANSILLVNSVVSKRMTQNMVYRGNPAEQVYARN